MKLFAYIFTFLAIAGLPNYFANSQDQQETQTVTGNQEIKPAVVTQDAQNQAQSSPVIKPKPFADELDIAGQFGYAIDKSSNFQDYKVIKQAWMSKLKANTLDTLINLKANLLSASALIQKKSTAIDSLKSLVDSAQSELKMKNSFRFFGIMVSKAGYDSIMWAIIIGLLVSLGFMFAAFRRSYAVTNQTKKDLHEVQEEFELFRKKALKSKEEAVRQLYDELNKYKKQK